MFRYAGLLIALLNGIFRSRQYVISFVRALFSVHRRSHEMLKVTLNNGSLFQPYYSVHVKDDESRTSESYPNEGN